MKPPKVREPREHAATLQRVVASMLCDDRYKPEDLTQIINMLEECARRLNKVQISRNEVSIEK